MITIASDLNAFLLCILLEVKALAEVNVSQLFIFATLLSDDVQLTAKQLFNAGEVLHFRVEVFIMKFHAALVQFLEDAVDFADWPFSTVTHLLTPSLKITFFCPSNALKVTSKLADLLLMMQADRYKPIGCIEH